MEGRAGSSLVHLATKRRAGAWLAPMAPLGLSLVLAACGGGDSGNGTTPLPLAGAVNDAPVLFVTQVPMAGDFTTVTATFGNHRPTMQKAPRGGDLWIRYADGSLKNLTKTAGFGMEDMQGAQAIAVRDPSVHWTGTKALFSMVVGAPTRQFQNTTFFWQIYEITGLGKNETPVITKAPNQPANFNNVTPLYGTDDRIIYTSDRPRSGEAHLYPQHDEYESTAVVTGLWSLDRGTGDLQLLNHAPSGNFTPFIDSFGRVVFTQWDHLKRDQQADADKYAGGTNGTFNFASEAANAARLNDRTEVFPEPRVDQEVAGTNMNKHDFNTFFPWAIFEDGTEGETLNHIGRQELHGYLPAALNDDPNVIEFYGQYPRFNRNRINNLFQIKEDPLQPGRFIAVDAEEFRTRASGQIVSFLAPPTLNADQMSITYLTHRDTASYHEDNQPVPPNHSGHYRDPLPLASGVLIAAHTAETRKDEGPTGTSSPARYDFRLKTLKTLPNGYLGPSAVLTSGISKSLSYWDPDKLVTYSGNLWELQPVEVRPRVRPAKLIMPTPGDALQLIQQAGVNVATLKNYMVQNNLALTISRNVTVRDDLDRQQPQNLRVPGGVQTLRAGGGRIYDVAHWQLFQADQVRGIGGTANPRAGRRVLAQTLHDAPAVAANKPNPGGPQGSVAVAPDGSVAAFVPARRAMTWQLTDPQGNPVVRERFWVTFQPGEIRVCGSCHGVNDKSQSGGGTPTNAPQALTELMNYWKSQNP